MPTPNLSPAPVTGARRMTADMFDHVSRADAFPGLPAGSAKPMRFLGAFQEAEPYLGLPTHAFKLVSWLVRQTQPQDWEAGSRPIAWPSARRQEEFLNLSSARVKALNRALFEAGIFVIRDNEQGKRYGRRCAVSKRIIEAFGFDLSPLAQRYDEFVRLAAEAKIERDRKKDGRRRVTLARRAIRQIGEQLTELDALPNTWAQLEREVAALVAAAARAEQSGALAAIAGVIEQHRADAGKLLSEAAAQAASKPVETSPSGIENEPHIITTNLTMNLKDTVIANEGSSPPQPAVPPAPPSVNFAEREFRLKPSQLLELAPRLAAVVLTERPTWPDIVAGAAQYLRPELGVSPSLWGEACIVMGREVAAVALAVVSTKPAAEFTRGAGAYFAGMLRKAERGELRLERTIWRLRGQKYKPRQRSETRYGSVA